MRKFILISSVVIFGFYCLYQKSIHSMEYSSDEYSSDQDAPSDMENFVWYQTYTEFTDEETALSDSVRNSRRDGIIKAIQDGADPNQFYDNPLSWAIKKNDLELAKFLADKGATIQQPIYGNSTLIELIKNISSDERRKEFEKLFDLQNRNAELK
ncbi:MAG TPA: hypothetical protein VHO47_00855 [Candidatus Babeliales bacterium]|nr:hypothetical protein [Candidatus Babeliales bacterium]